MVCSIREYYPKLHVYWCVSFKNRYTWFFFYIQFININKKYQLKYFISMPICVFRYISGYVMYIEKGTNGVFFSIVRCANDCWGFDHCWLFRSCVVRNTKAWGPNKKLGRDVNHVINPLFKVQFFFIKKALYQTF